jgi:hypothetical protein
LGGHSLSHSDEKVARPDHGEHMPRDHASVWYIVKWTDPLAIGIPVLITIVLIVLNHLGL